MKASFRKSDFSGRGFGESEHSMRYSRQNRGILSEAVRFFLAASQRTSALQGGAPLGTGERELSQSGAFWITAILIVSLFSGCSGGELPVANTSGFDYREVAFQFTEALTERDYDRAYAMTSQDYQRCISVERLGTAFEPIDN